MHSQSVWITYKAVSAGAKARPWTRESQGSAEPASQPANHTANRTGLDLLLQTAESEAALLQLFILKGKLLSGKSPLLHGSDWSTNTALQGPGGPSHFLGATLQLPEALGKVWRWRKGFISAPGWFLIHRSVVLPSGGEDPMPSEDWGRKHDGGLVGTLRLAVSTRAVKAETVFHLLCFGVFKNWRNHKITSGLTLTMVILFHPRAKPHVQFSSLFLNSMLGTHVEVRRMVYRLPKSKFREKQELHWKDAFLGKSSHLCNINIISAQITVTVKGVND